MELDFELQRTSDHIISEYRKNWEWGQQETGSEHLRNPLGPQISLLEMRWRHGRSKERKNEEYPG